MKRSLRARATSIWDLAMSIWTCITDAIAAFICKDGVDLDFTRNHRYSGSVGGTSLPSPNIVRSWQCFQLGSDS